jgi:hypothetical protein
MGFAHVKTRHSLRYHRLHQTDPRSKPATVLGKHRQTDWAQVVVPACSGRCRSHDQRPAELGGVIAVEGWRSDFASR